LKPVRVLVVDDSAVVRTLIARVLGQAEGIEVVASASNGRIALERIEEFEPDLITLDIEMPEMDGLETVETIRKRGWGMPVIMFSTLTEHGGAATMKALALGASDYVAKPANVGKVSEGIAAISRELVPKVLALCEKKITRAVAKPVVPSVERSPLRPRVATTDVPPVDLLAIGSSTGGPQALSRVLSSMPPDLPFPIAIVQHMPPLFTRLFASQLDRASRLDVFEASDGMIMEPGCAYVAPGDYHMSVRRTARVPKVELDQGPQENSCRPAVDVLFRSAAKVYGGNVLAIVLTGMGVDGTEGARHVRDHGGRIVVQDEETSVVWGMPGSISRAGLADLTLPLGEIADWVVTQVTKDKKSARCAGESS
jgi:two-component system chemotaxis response regulator CheB